MLPGINPRKMQQMMKQLGIQQEDIPAKEVVIRTAEKEIVITSPSVAKVNMMGQETFQISGEVEERGLSSTPDISEEDIQAVVEQTGVDKDTAKKTIEKHQGDLAEAIMDLQEEK